jgi:XTP/dITP diphosphohydrolase
MNGTGFNGAGQNGTGQNGTGRNGQGALRFVLATANPDKAAEIVQIIAGVAGDRIFLEERPSSVPDVDETGDTLESNAMLKAFAIASATDSPAMADDTGLEVDALGGAPGVYSARYAGENATYSDNVAKLLSELDRVGAIDPDQRSARFKTVALVLYPGGRSFVAEGVIEGRIAPSAAGSGGFGYDSVFIPRDGDGRTFAEMSPVEKHSLSHRGKAFRALAVGLLGQGQLGLR